MSSITLLHHDNNFHELVFAEATRNSVEEFVGILTKFYENRDSEHLYLLLDLRQSGMLPLRLLTAKLRDLNQQYPDHLAIHIALALSDGTMMDVTSALMRTIMRRDSAQYFMDIEKARSWLNLEQSKYK